MSPLMESDLHQIIVSAQQLTEDHVKVFVYQVLRGIDDAAFSFTVYHLAEFVCNVKEGDFLTVCGVNGLQGRHGGLMSGWHPCPGQWFTSLPARAW